MDSMVEDTQTEKRLRCKGITKNGTLCKNMPMHGFKYCNKHQPLCIYNDTKLQSCRNYTSGDSNYCTFHLPVSKRDFLTKGVKIDGAIGTGGGIEYLISDLLEYFKNENNIDFLLPLTRKDSLLGEDIQKKISPNMQVPRVTNAGKYIVSVDLVFIDYSTGKNVLYTQHQLAPNESYIAITEVLQIPIDSSWGLTIGSTQPVNVSSIVKLETTNHDIDIYNSRFLEYDIPNFTKNNIVYEIQNIFSTIALGIEGRVQSVLNVPCNRHKNRIYFDRRTILDGIKDTAATEGVFLLQLEGLIFFSKQSPKIINKYHLPPHSRVNEEEIANRFETTIEILNISMWDIERLANCLFLSNEKPTT